MKAILPGDFLQVSEAAGILTMELGPPAFRL